MFDTIGRYFQAATNVIHKAGDAEWSVVKAQLETAAALYPIAYPGTLACLIHKEAQRLKHQLSDHVLTAG